MSDLTIVLDAGVLAKAFLDEPDRDQAIELLKFIGDRKPLVLAPTLVEYEFYSIAAQNQVPLPQTYDLFERYQRQFLNVMELTKSEWKKVFEMALAGHPKSGYPSIYDSTYHTLANDRGGWFVTADRRHLAKTVQFGHVCLLADWRTHLDPES